MSMPLFVASVITDARHVAELATLHALIRSLVVLSTGVWVDRFNRLPLIVAANLLRGIVLLGLALTIQFDGGSRSVIDI